MNKVVLVSIIALMLGGCAEMNAQRQANLQSSYNDISSCEIPDVKVISGEISKSSFAGLPTSEAYAASSDDFVMKTNLDRLRVVGWNDKVSKAVLDCGVKKTNTRISTVKSQFKKMKDLTKDPDEKKALIATYSAWETYVVSPTESGEQDFDTKLSYYRNM